MPGQIRVKFDTFLPLTFQRSFSSVLQTVNDSDYFAQLTKPLRFMTAVQAICSIPTATMNKYSYKNVRCSILFRFTSKCNLIVNTQRLPLLFRITLSVCSFTNNRFHKAYLISLVLTEKEILLFPFSIE